MPFGKHLKDMRDLMILGRFQNKYMHKRRTVAEHLCSTAVIAQWLTILENNLFNNNVDMGEVLQRAINYNLSQVFIGNILSSNKAMSKNMEDAINNVKAIAYKEYIEPELPLSWRNDFERFITKAKDSSKEGKIILAADLIDTALECIEEINLDNRSFYDILEKVLLSVKEIELDSIKYMFKYVFNSFNLEFKSTNDNKIDNRKIIIYNDKLYEYISNLTFDEHNPKIIDYKRIGNYIYEYRTSMDILRYHNKFMFRRTSDAAHMWNVAKISQGLALWMEKKFDVKVDMANVLSRSINHDVNEIYTGDILSTTKRMTSLMRQAVNKSEETAFNEILPNIPKEMQNDFTTYILHPKDDTVEGKILSAADIIDTIFECSTEVNLGNKEIFGGILKKVSTSLLNINLEAVDYFILFALRDINKNIKGYFGKDIYNRIKYLRRKYYLNRIKQQFRKIF